MIFITDAYRSFSIIKGSTDVFYWPSTTIPEVILVGIGYGRNESNSIVKWAAGRTRDLTPEKDSIRERNIERAISSLGFNAPDVETGGASDFLDFIRNELFPYILEADVFMSAGELEKANSSYVKKMEELLLSRNYKNLILETVIFEDETHTSSGLTAISRGLVEIFNNKKQ